MLLSKNDETTIFLFCFDLNIIINSRIFFIELGMTVLELWTSTVLLFLTVQKKTCDYMFLSLSYIFLRLHVTCSVRCLSLSLSLPYLYWCCAIYTYHLFIFLYNDNTIFKSIKIKSILLHFLKKNCFLIPHLLID